MSTCKQFWLSPFASCLLLCLACFSCYRRPDPLRSYLAFVANHDGNAVAIVDLGRLSVIRAIPVAPGPAQLAVRPGTQEVWAVSDSGSISAIEFPQLQLTRSLHLGSSAKDLVFSPDGRFYYVLATDAAGKSQVIFGDGKTGKPVPGDSGIAAGYRFGSLGSTPDGKTLIAADLASNSLVFISTESREILGSVKVGKAPGSMAVVLDGHKVFVADTAENKISAVDVVARQILSHIEISSRPTLLKLKPDGGELFALSADSNQMTILDSSHDYVEQSYPTGDRPAAAVFRLDSSVIYVANAGDGSVTAFDAQNRVVLNSTHAGTQPDALALTPDERFLVVADGASSSVAILRADPNETDSKHNPYLAPNRSVLVTTIPVGGKPVAVLIPDWLRKE